MNCEYCGTKNKVDSERCTSCGAAIKAVNDKPQKNDYFSMDFYNGYVVYRFTRFMTDSIEIQFWLGQELLERFDVSRCILDEHVQEGCDIMPFFWELFLLARGEKEVIYWQEKNNKYPARFEIRRIENEEKRSLLSMSMEDLAYKFRKS